MAAYHGHGGVQMLPRRLPSFHDPPAAPTWLLLNGSFMVQKINSLTRLSIIRTDNYQQLLCLCLCLTLALASCLFSFHSYRDTTVNTFVACHN